jgi:hypothetical protein
VEVGAGVAVWLGELAAVAVGILFPELDAAAGTVGSAVSVGDGLGVGLNVAVNVKLGAGLAVVGDTTETVVGVAPHEISVLSTSSRQQITSIRALAENDPPLRSTCCLLRTALGSILECFWFIFPHKSCQR